MLYLFQACGDAKSKPGFLSDKTLESSIKYIVRRFPSIDIKGVSPILFYFLVLGCTAGLVTDQPVCMPTDRVTISCVSMY
jgi:hypothetical protein